MPSSDPATAAAATPASAVAERGRKLVEAVDRIFADIYSASKVTRSGADKAQSAQVERVLAPYEKLAARYGFKPLEPPEGSRSFLLEKYLPIVLYSGRWRISDSVAAWIKRAITNFCRDGEQQSRRLAATKYEVTVTEPFPFCEIGPLRVRRVCLATYPQAIGLFPISSTSNLEYTRASHVSSRALWLPARRRSTSQQLWWFAVLISRASGLCTAQNESRWVLSHSHVN